MKIFCQKCGKQLGDYMRICPSCGFENMAMPQKNRNFTMIFLLLLVCATVGGFLYKGKTHGYYALVKNNGVNAVLNGDAAKKQEFEKVFSEYETARLSFETKNTLRLYEKNIPEIASFIGKDEDNKALKMTSNLEKESFENVKQDLRKTVSYCSSSKENLEKCSVYKESTNGQRLQKCDDCNEKISTLYQISASLKDKAVANQLVGFIDLLRGRQALYDSEEFIRLPNQVFEEVYCIAKQVDTMRQGSESSEYMGMIWHLVAREKCFAKMSELNARFYIKNNQINEEGIHIKDYMSVLNGNIGMNLK